MPPTTEPAVPPFPGNISFNAQHSPMGAFFSFTCGHFGTRGGLGVQLGKPANQNIFIGVKRGDRRADAPLYCLPFYKGADRATEPQTPDVAQQTRAANFLGEQAETAAPKAEEPKLIPYRREQVQRHYGWATDRWVTPDFEFTIYTPFGPLADPSAAEPDRLRYSLLPAVWAELTVDNVAGKETKTGVFSLSFPEPGARLIDRGLGTHAVGFAWRQQTGAAGYVFNDGDRSEIVPFAFQRWSPDQGLRDPNPVHLLGNCPGFGFEVPAGRKATLVLALGGYAGGVVTTRLEATYLYARHFADLTDVLRSALNSCQPVGDARALDARLLSSGLSPDQQFLLAHATRSYYGSTQLLDVAGQPYWVVNEGEYCMLNTLDLSVDQVFWELRFNPWVVRNLLDHFVRHYSYHDQLKDPKTGQLRPGGISFCHDQGVHNNFSPFGHSSYELTNLKGCFSHMTQEQLCNWVLVAACYAAKTNDVDWLRHNKPTLEACLSSLLNRDEREPDRRNGVMSYDSSRCGPDGQEITTYDSLDPSLAQARGNLYLAVKCWASYLGLVMMFRKLGDYCETAENAARYCANTIAGHLRDDGSIPAVFEKSNPGYHSRVLPAVEGLVYPLYWQTCDLAAEFAAGVLDDLGDYRSLIDALRRHVKTLLDDPENRNRFPDGGWRLSSSASNSWMSKIALAQHVVREVFELEDGDERQKAADAAHVKWQTEGASAYWAMSDQMVNGVAIGSRYYPRCVTAVLWLKEEGQG